MAVVGIRELKSHAAALVGRVEGGEPVIVSRYGKPVAVIVPLDMDIEELLVANSSAIAERRARALESLDRGAFVRAEDLDAAIEAERETSRDDSADLSSYPNV